MRSPLGPRGFWVTGVVVSVATIGLATPVVALIAALRECAGARAVDPLAVTTRLSLVGPEGTALQPDLRQQLPGAYFSDLPAHHCLEGPIDFAVPSPDVVSNVTFGIDEKAVWPAS